MFVILCLLIIVVGILSGCTANEKERKTLTGRITKVERSKVDGTEWKVWFESGMSLDNVEDKNILYIEKGRLVKITFVNPYTIGHAWSIEYYEYLEE